MDKCLDNVSNSQFKIWILMGVKTDSYEPFNQVSENNFISSKFLLQLQHFFNRFAKDLLENMYKIIFVI